MRRALIIALAVAFFGGAESAWSCSCVKAGNPRTEVARADGAFVGVFRSRRPVTAQPGLYIYSFRVERVLKGRVARGVDVFAPDSSASCGLATRRGQRVGLLLERRARRWHSSLCWQREPSFFRGVATRRLAAACG